MVKQSECYRSDLFFTKNFIVNLYIILSIIIKLLNRVFDLENKSQRKSKKFLTFPDLCANMTIEGQRKSKSKQNVVFIFDFLEYLI